LFRTNQWRGGYVEGHGYKDMYDIPDIVIYGDYYIGSGDNPFDDDDWDDDGINPHPNPNPDETGGNGGNYPPGGGGGGSGNGTGGGNGNNGGGNGPTEESDEEWNSHHHNFKILKKDPDGTNYLSRGLYRVIITQISGQNDSITFGKKTITYKGHLGRPRQPWIDYFDYSNGIPESIHGLEFSGASLQLFIEIAILTGYEWEAFYTGGATPDDDKPFYIRTVYNKTACSGDVYHKDCDSFVHSHPDSLDESEPDKFTACLYKEIYKYNYFGIYSVRDKQIREFKPFSLEDANEWADANGVQIIVPPQ